MATKKSAASKSRTKAATAKVTAKAPSKTATRARIQAQQDYTTKSGDTLKSVAEKFQVPLKFLARANSVSESATLSAGVSLRIPELKLNPFGQAEEGWVEIGPIWYQKGTNIGEDRIIVAKVQGKRLKV